MGNLEADRASPIGAATNEPAGASTPPASEPAGASTPLANEPVGATTPPLPDARAPQETPLWMEGSAPRPQARRGHSAAVPRSGLHTLLFFALIVFVVGAAGVGGVALWGPEKTIKNRTQFATNPPAPLELPSLSGPAEAPPAGEGEPAPAPSASTAPQDESPAADVASPKKTPAPAKAKRPRAGGKKTR
ncbi:MAG: hypothetical protein KIS78_27255 [Labilithrix sp.]|nr:hypothetical protein [Labilithrix sp.]MCW5836129.1 hypothetical protein [Labilithrix sp.]